LEPLIASKGELVMVRFGFVAMFTLITIGCRMGVGTPNFSPLLAFSLFAGACLSNRAMAYFLPLGTLLVTDLYLGIHSTMFFTYLSVFLLSLGGECLLKENTRGWKGLTLGAICSSLLFFFLTNFGVWALTSLYSHTWQGLVTCYEAGIPFFRTSLASTALFSYLFFFGYARGVAWVEASHRRGSAVASR
jgi:hypothetical protein